MKLSTIGKDIECLLCICWVAFFLSLGALLVLIVSFSLAHASDSFTPPFADNGTDGEKGYCVETWPDSHEWLKENGWLKGETVKNK